VGQGLSYGNGNSNFFGTGFSTASGDFNGPIVGGQIGANYQTGMAVLGFEVDAQWSGQKSTTTANCGFGCTTNETVEIDAFGTGRVRAGLALNPFLLYATGGLAWTSAKDSLTASAFGLNFNVVSVQATKVGWTAGAGIEMDFGAGFSGKLEYLYITTDQITATAPVPFLLGGGTITETANIRDSIVRFGVNYRF
jgi:outer membrane immunogenic protein